MYGAAWCRFCRAAKLLLAECGIPFRYVDVEALGGPAAVIDALEVAQKTIPIVYSDGGHIGGYDSLCAQLGKPLLVNEKGPLGFCDDFELTPSATELRWDLKDSSKARKGEPAAGRRRSCPARSPRVPQTPRGA